MPTKKRTKAAEDNRRRQAEFVARQKAAGLRLMRGVWVPADRHDEIRDRLVEYIKALG